MSLKNLSAIKIPKLIKRKLFNKRINNLYQLFEKNFQVKGGFIVAVSGGADSLALAYLAKVYSVKNKIDCKFFIVDHKLRKESTKEAKNVKKILNNLGIKSNILTWKGKKPTKNIQALARQKRYELLFSKCKNFKIKNLVIGHHFDDLLENFFIRLVRGSGLKGLVSFGKKNNINEINLIRPLLDFKKKDLIFISSYVFEFFVTDPSNEDTKFMRIRLRKLINELQKNGLNKDKMYLTIKNLKSTDQAIKFYVEQNKNINSFFDSKKKELFLNENFFKHPYEVVFRSLSDCLKLVGEMYNLVRGKKIDNILKKISENKFNKETLGGCIIKKVKRTVIISKEYQI